MLQAWAPQYTRGDEVLEDNPHIQRGTLDQALAELHALGGDTDMACIKVYGG